jgi:hypothetical protein
MAPGLSEYEKSVFLTKAQEDLVIGFYSGKNANRISFEETEEARRYLDLLTKTQRLIPMTPTVAFPISSDSKFFTAPSDLWYITYEEVILEDTTLPHGAICNATVKPTTQDSYYKKKRNPFKYPSNNKVFRMSITSATYDSSGNTNLIELISKYNIKEYIFRYLKQPKPIILEALTGGATINSVSQRTECELPKSTHSTILKLSVDMAKMVYDSQRK